MSLYPLRFLKSQYRFPPSPFFAYLRCVNRGTTYRELLHYNGSNTLFTPTAWACCFHTLRTLAALCSIFMTAHGTAGASSHPDELTFSNLMKMEVVSRLGGSANVGGGWAVLAAERDWAEKNTHGKFILREDGYGRIKTGQNRGRVERLCTLSLVSPIHEHTEEVRKSERLQQHIYLLLEIRCSDVEAQVTFDILFRKYSIWD